MITPSQRLVSAFLFLISACPAFADGGWYLFLPPTTHYDASAKYLDGYKLIPGSPLSAWQQESAFDSAAQCEEAKAVLAETAQRFCYKLQEDYLKTLGEKGKDELADKRGGVELAHEGVIRTDGSRCIKSDDPRLAH